MILLMQLNRMQGLKEQIQHLSSDLVWLSPEISLVITAVLLLLYDLIFEKNKSAGLAAIAFVGFAFAFAQLILSWESALQGQSLMNDLLYWDRGAVFLKSLFSVGALISLIMMVRSKKATSFFESSEPLLMLIGLVLGTFLMTMAVNLLAVYVAIELVSICSYVLTGIFRGKRNSEAAIKYLLFGAVASAIMLYGMSWLYGFTGTLAFTSPEFIEGISIIAPLPLALALIMTLGGFLFKLGAFPFHIWSPDVYQATPSPFVAVFSALPKLAALALIFRFVANLNPEIIDWQLWLGLVAIASMTVGNFSALWQRDVKRMLAYSSIAQAGFLLVGVMAYSESGKVATLFYGAVYLFMNFAAFFLVQWFEQADGNAPLKKFRGRGTQMPLMGALLLIVMISLTGLPPTAGFNAKLFVFSAIWEGWQVNGKEIFIWVFIVGLLNTVVALFYYLKIPYYMFFKERTDNELCEGYRRWDKLLGTILVAPLLLWFFKSDWLLNIVNSINFVF